MWSIVPPASILKDDFQDGDEYGDGGQREEDHQDVEDGRQYNQAAVGTGVAQDP